MGLSELLSYIPVILQFLLFFIMFGMGMTLSIGDFKRVAIYPKAVSLGLLSQIVFLPLIAFVIVKLIPLEAAFAMGMMVVAVSPGGAVSNLISHLSKGDTALSITLTAFSSLLTIVSIPILLNWSLGYFMDGESAQIQLPFLKTVYNIFKLTVLPVALGVCIHYTFPDFVKRVNTAIAILSVLVIVIALVLIYIKLVQLGDVMYFVRTVFWSVLLLNIVTLAFGYGVARLGGLDTRQSITISIETGMQNNVLGMAIATAPGLLNSPLMAVPAGVYGLLMCLTAAGLIFVFRKILKNESAI